MDDLRLAERKKELKPERLAWIREALAARSIVLIGLMGAGKTAVGRRLANRLELPFTDADNEIETAAGRIVSEIFAEHGGPYFRHGNWRVIACVSIWLKAEVPVLLHRVRRRDNRPLLASDDPDKVMRELMEKRYPIYAEADITVESRDVAHDLIVGDVVEALARWLDKEAEAAAAKTRGKV